MSTTSKKQPSNGEDGSNGARAARWLLLIHQLPPKPPYLRAKIGRHLERVGAVAIKNAVYVLPSLDSAREDYAWIRQEILDGGGEAWVCEATFVDGLSSDQIEALFHEARNADYDGLAEAARAVLGKLPRRGDVPEELREQLQGDATRLEKRLAEIVAIDFFGASRREAVAGLVRSIEAQLGRRVEAPRRSEKDLRPADVQARTWVTRKGIYVDRIASAWLVRRFIDPKATFKFVPAKAYVPEPGELIFDMFEAEFTHEGDRCTFEVPNDRFGLQDPALRAVGEIIHDIDLKDEKFGRAERPGVERMINGMAAARKDDEARLARGSALFDDLYESFTRKAD